MEDAQILALYFARDESAISHTDAKYGTRLLGLAQNITGNAEDARECVNDTYLDAWNRIPPHRPGSLFGYLAKILRHKSLDLLDRLRAGKRSATVVELSQELEMCIPAPGGTESRMEREELRRVLRSFVAGLDERNQYIFVRRYFYMDRIVTIADSLKTTEGSVRTALHRSRNKLRQLLEKEGIAL